MHDHYKKALSEIRGHGHPGGSHDALHKIEDGEHKGHHEHMRHHEKRSRK